MSFEIVFATLGTNVSVATDDARMHAWIRALTATFEPISGPAELRYQLRTGARHELFLDDTPLREAHVAIDLPPLFELDVHERVLERVHEGLVVHAAALARGDRAIVLAGPSGAGKSTMSAALIERGFLYLTDECAWIDPALRVRGFRRPISFDDESTARAAHPGPFVPYELRGIDGSMQRRALIHPSSNQCFHGAAQLAAWVLLRRDPNAEPLTRRLSPADATLRLWSESRRRQHDAMETLLGAVSNVPAFEVVTRSVEQACRDVIACCDAVGV